MGTSRYIEWGVHKIGMDVRIKIREVTHGQALKDAE